MLIVIRARNKGVRSAYAADAAGKDCIELLGLILDGGVASARAPKRTARSDRKCILGGIAICQTKVDDWKSLRRVVVVN